MSRRMKQILADMDGTHGRQSQVHIRACSMLEIWAQRRGGTKVLEHRCTIKTFPLSRIHAQKEHMVTQMRSLQLVYLFLWSTDAKTRRSISPCRTPPHLCTHTVTLHRNNLSH